MIYALTDFLVVLGCGFGIWRLWPHRRKGAVRMVRLGLAIIGLAALVGMIRFVSGDGASMADLHAISSRFAGSAGLILVAGGLAWQAFSLSPPAGIGRYIRIGIPVVIAGMLVWPGGAALLTPVPVIAIVLGVAGSSTLLYRRSWNAGAWWLASWVLIGLNALLLDGSREVTTLGIANWHLYHAVLGLWAALAGEATRRMIARAA